MKVLTKTAIAGFGGAAAVVLTVGFGRVGISSTGGASATATHPSTSLTSAQPDSATPGVHLATLTSCVAGLDC
jgi:hypothetical protein